MATTTSKQELINQCIEARGLTGQAAEKARKAFDKQDAEEVKAALDKILVRKEKQKQREQASAAERERIHKSFEHKNLLKEKKKMYNHLKKLRIQFLQDNNFEPAILSPEVIRNFEYLVNAEYEEFEDGLHELILEGLKFPNKQWEGKKPNACLSQIAADALRKSIKDRKATIGFWARMIGNEHRRGRITRKALRILIEMKDLLIQQCANLVVPQFLAPQLEIEKEILAKAQAENDERMLLKTSERIDLMKQILEIYKTPRYNEE